MLTMMARPWNTGLDALPIQVLQPIEDNASVIHRIYVCSQESRRHLVRVHLSIGYVDYSSIDGFVS